MNLRHKDLNIPIDFFYFVFVEIHIKSYLIRRDLFLSQNTFFFFI